MPPKKNQKLLKSVSRPVRAVGASLEDDVLSVFRFYMSDITRCLLLFLVVFMTFAAEAYLEARILHTVQAVFGPGEVLHFVKANMLRVCGAIILTAGSFAATGKILSALTTSLIVVAVMDPSKCIVYAMVSLMFMTLSRSKHSLMKLACVGGIAYLTVTPFINGRYHPPAFVNFAQPEPGVRMEHTGPVINQNLKGKQFV